MKLMALEKQMEMFEDGGLMDEGGTIDPVSGNDVPVGSTQEEVRDDIPAQLSEGEFVFPADVVRYFGLEKLMEMRQEAKAGLQRMEDMGQMGNSEEAILPDDIPFDIDDLDMEDEEEYNYQVGGFVPGTAQQQQMGIAGYQAPVMQQTGVAQIPQQQYTAPPIPQPVVPQMQPFARPQQQAVPTMPVPEQLPTFEQAVTPPTGMAPENREYINPETGERRTFTFINNQPTTEIPAGFIPISDYTAAPTAKPQTTKVKTAQVTEDDDQPDDDKPAGKIAFGGEVGSRGAVEGAFRANLSINLPEKGLAGAFYGLTEGRSRTLGSALDAITGGRLGTPLSLRPGEEAIISDIELPKPRGSVARAEVLPVNIRLDATTFNDLYTREGGSKVTQRKELARIARHLDEFYNKPENKGMVVDVDRRMRDQIKTMDSARQAIQEDSGPFVTITETSDGEDNNIQVSRDIAEKVSQGVDLEAAAWESGFDFGSSDTSSNEIGNDDFGNYDASYDDIFNKGGLASKKKPKPKRMKRGGLASKK
jgi:hypothetical protein